MTAINIVINPEKCKQNSGRVREYRPDLAGLYILQWETCRDSA